MRSKKTKPDNEVVNSVKIQNFNTTPVRRIKDVNWILRILTTIGPTIFKLLSSTRITLRILEQAGDVSKFLLWQYDTFHELQIFRTKKSHFDRVIREIRAESKLYDVFEFGVAHGYATQYFIEVDENLPSFISTYRGFDTFFGLPSSYRGFKKGSFSNSGKFPDIKSIKLVWHKGLVEDTVKPELFLTQPKFLMFDLDLYEPTFHVLKCITPNLQIGDILYFDEAFDEGEFKIILNEVLPYFRIKYLGTNGQSLALKIEGRLVENS